MLDRARAGDGNERHGRIRAPSPARCARMRTLATPSSTAQTTRRSILPAPTDVPLLRETPSVREPISRQQLRMGPPEQRRVPCRASAREIPSSPLAPAASRRWPRTRGSGPPGDGAARAVGRGSPTPQPHRGRLCWLGHPWLKAMGRAVDTAPGHRASARCDRAASVGGGRGVSERADEVTSQHRC